MTDDASLLPAIATPWERALSLTSAERRPLPAELIKAVWDPDACPPHLLGHLAWAMSVDIWDDAWSDERKRAVIRRSLDLHRRKGTLSAIRDYIDLAGGQLVSALTPPQGFFASADADASNPGWRRWLHSLPEIRINRVQTIAGVHGLAVDGDEDGLPAAAFVSDEEDGPATWFAGADLLPLEVEYATLIEAGVETRISMVREPDTRYGRTGEVVRFALNGEAGFGWFADDALSADRYVGGAPDRADALTAKLGPVTEPDTGWNLVVEATDRVQDVQPEAGSFADIDGYGLFADDFWEGGHIAGVEETKGVFFSLRLMRPGLTLEPSASFCDADRLGMAPFTAELRTLVPGRASRAIFFADHSHADGGHAAEDPDTSALDAVCDAVSAAKAVRDRVYLDLDVVPKRRSLARTRRLSELQIR